MEVKVNALQKTLPSNTIIVNLREPGDGIDTTLSKQTERSAQPIKKDDVQQQWNWDILWFDHGGLTPEFLSFMLPWQRVNHFLGMYNIARKNTLGIHLKRFLKEFPKDYKFFPNTWLYPAEFFDINEFYNQKVQKRQQKIKDGKISATLAQTTPVELFICKPEASSQGKGIFIVRKLDEMRTTLNAYLQQQQKQFQEYIQAQEYLDTAQFYSQRPIYQNTQQQIFSVNVDQSQSSSNQQQQSGLEPPKEFEKNNSYVIQKYLKHPALINGHKFDFRIYVLITSVYQPMTIFVYRDGLVRLASEKYDMNKNISDPYVHLTNYSLNKKNQNYDGESHKLRLNECLRGGFTSTSDKGTFSKNSQQIWKEIDEIVIKTVVTIQPQLQHYYRMSQPKEPDLCYELLGFDIILDYSLKPWLLEVNHLPSFNSDTQTDEQVKFDLIRDMFQILQLSIENRKKIFREMKAEQMRQSQQQGCFKRLSVKEHCERVKFDPKLVEKTNPDNKFKLVYPCGKGDDDYNKYHRKAIEIWQMTTGTYKQQQKSHKEKKKKEHKSRHRKQSQLVDQQKTVEFAAKLNESIKSSEDQDYSRKSTINEGNNRHLMGQKYEMFEQKMKENQKTNILSASTEVKESLILLNEERMPEDEVHSKSKTDQAFFDKRNQTAKEPIPHILKQNSQRFQFKSAMRQSSSNPRSSLITNQKPSSRQTPQTQTINHKGNNLIPHHNNIDSQLATNLLNKRGTNTQLQKTDVDDDDTPNLLDKSDVIAISDISQRLIQSGVNVSHLKYKEYCKALLDDLNQAYYKSGLLLNDNSRSITHGLNSISSNINTLVLPPQPLNIIGPQQPGGQSNNFLNKLHSIIHSHQGRQLGSIQGRQNRMLVGTLASPSSQNKGNLFQSSLVKSKEDLAVISSQHRVLMRSDSIKTGHKPHIVDMAPINLSAGVIDFKLQYRRIHQQQRKINSGHPLQKQSQSIGMRVQQQQQHISPKIRLQWVNDSNDLANNGSGNDDKNAQKNGKQKKESNKSRALSIQQQPSLEKNLDRLKEYERKLLLNTGSQHPVSTYFNI